MRDPFSKIVGYFYLFLCILYLIVGIYVEHPTLTWFCLLASFSFFVVFYVSRFPEKYRKDDSEIY